MRDIADWVAFIFGRIVNLANYGPALLITILCIMIIAWLLRHPVPKDNYDRYDMAIKQLQERIPAHVEEVEHKAQEADRRFERQTRDRMPGETY